MRLHRAAVLFPALLLLPHGAARAQEDDPEVHEAVPYEEDVEEDVDEDVDEERQAAPADEGPLLERGEPEELAPLDDPRGAARGGEPTVEYKDRHEPFLELAEIGLRAWYLPFLDGQVERERSNVGNELTEDKLGLEDDVWAPVIFARIQLVDFVSVSTEYFVATFRGRELLNPTDGFAFNGHGFFPGERIDTKQRIQSWRLLAELAYEGPNSRLGGSVGVRLLTVHTRIRAPGRTRADSRTSIWSPSLGVILDFRSEDLGAARVGGYLKFSFFAWPETADRRWAWADLELGFHVTLLEHARLELGMRYFAAYMRTDHETDDELAEFQLWGPSVGVSVLF